jgi:hypothetical protein
MLVIHPHPSPTIPNFHEFSHKYNIINIQLDGFCKPSLNVASVHRWKMLKKKIDSVAPENPNVLLKGEMKIDEKVGKGQGAIKFSTTSDALVH